MISFQMLSHFLYMCLLIIVNMSSCIDGNNYYGGEQDVTEAVKIRLYPTDEQKKLINQNMLDEYMGF